MAADKNKILLLSEIVRKNGFNIAMFVLVVFALFLRLWQLGLDSFWVDELHQLRFSYFAKDHDEVLMHTRHDVHPPFFNYLAFWWSRLFYPQQTPNEIPFRFLSATFGSGAIVVLAYGTSGILSKGARLLLVGFAAVAFFPLEFSRYFRSYGLIVFLASAVFVVLLRLVHNVAVKKPVLWKYWFFLAVSGMLLSLTHYLGAMFFYVGVGCVLVMVRNAPRYFKLRLLCVAAFVSVFFLYWLHSHYGWIAHLTNGNFWITEDKYLFAGKLYELLFTHPDTPSFNFIHNASITHKRGALWPLGLLFGGAFVCGVFFYKRRDIRHKNPAFLFVLVLIVAYLLTLGVVSLHTPMVTVRNLIYVHFPIFTLVAFALFPFGAAKNKFYKARIIIAVVLLGWYGHVVLNSFYKVRLEDHRGVANFIRSFESCKDSVILGNMDYFYQVMYDFYGQEEYSVFDQSEAHRWLDTIKQQKCPVVFISYVPELRPYKIGPNYRKALEYFKPLGPLKRVSFLQMVLLVKETKSSMHNKKTGLNIK